MSLQSKYSSLSRASLSYRYLHTNSTTHEFLFGALAELVDNSRDANSTKLSIYTVKAHNTRGGYLLCFLDDGYGMDAVQANNVMTFGMSDKKSHDHNMIGMYGNGLKSGSMRIGNDFIMFTKQGQQMSCILLSRTFHEEEQINEVVVPIPVFSTITKKSIAVTEEDKERVRLEMEIIYKYSPFKNESEIMSQFNRIEQGSGTLVVVYNLKLMDNGEPELDVKTDPFDIRMTAYDISDEGLPLEKRSFRAYASVLYMDPRMRLYIQGKKVRSRKLITGLYKCRMYTYTSNRFKARAEKAVEAANIEAKHADFEAREAESKARNLERKYVKSTSKSERMELRKSQQSATVLRAEFYRTKLIWERKQRELKETKTLKFYFGININNKGEDGMFIYNCSRLIKMYTRVGPQLVNNRVCGGVMGIVDVPYLVLEPTHNKQDFANAKEYRLLIKTLAEYMQHYWRDIDLDALGLEKFWDRFGYSSLDKRLPSIEKQYMKKRAMQVSYFIQCDLCLKWRSIPFSSGTIGKMYPDNWHCSMNPDKQFNRCSTTEQKISIHTNVFKRPTKSLEQKKDEINNAIIRKQAELDKYNEEETSSEEDEKLPFIDESNVKKIRVKNQSRTKNKRKYIEESDSEDDEIFDINSAVSVKLDNVWKNAVIVAKNTSRKTYKVKFDQKPHDCFDKWIKWGNSIKGRKVQKEVSSVSSTSSNTHTQSSSLVPADYAHQKNLVDKLSTGYRTCIRYFLPPQWKYTKDEIFRLTTDDLVNFQLDELFYNYELGLRKLVSNIGPMNLEDGSTTSSRPVSPAATSTTTAPTTTTTTAAISSSSAADSAVPTSSSSHNPTSTDPTTTTTTTTIAEQQDNQMKSSFPLTSAVTATMDNLTERSQQELLEQQHRQLVETQRTLSRNRILVVQLLKSINTDFDIPYNCDTSDVDDLLEQCVAQVSLNDLEDSPVDQDISAYAPSETQKPPKTSSSYQTSTKTSNKPASNRGNKSKRY